MRRGQVGLWSQKPSPLEGRILSPNTGEETTQSGRLCGLRMIYKSA